MFKEILSFSFEAFIKPSVNVGVPSAVITFFSIFIGCHGIQPKD